MSVSSSALPNLTEAPLTPFCQFRQFLTWGPRKIHLHSLPRGGGGSVVREERENVSVMPLKSCRRSPPGGPTRLPTIGPAHRTADFR